jgi:hypothetical protein
MRFLKLFQPNQVLTLLLLLSISSCDDFSQTNGIPDKTITLLQLESNPDTLSFRNSLSIKDTTVTVEVFVQVEDKTDILGNPTVNLYEKGDFQLLEAAELTNWNENNKKFSGSFTFTLSTGISTETELIATALASNGNATNFLRKNFTIQGLTLNPAILENPINPDTLVIPVSGSLNFLLGIKAIHPDGQRFISQVTVNLKDKDNANLGDYSLYDDGSNILLENNLPSGDLISADSVFSRSFTINSSNNPDIITLTYKAVDSSNQPSNTVTSTMVIVR